ncbi:MAG: globin-like protein [Verrucomicrobiales bacterium]|nr:globin-like protein [Verrucomicrobiales bacterium]
MINPTSHIRIRAPKVVSSVPLAGLAFLMAVLAFAGGCGTSKPEKKQDEFFTSGSKEADQRASQRMAKSEQLSGSGEGAGEKKVKKAEPAKKGEAGSTEKAAQAEGKLTLFERLGGEKGITAVIDDFLPRAVQDPRVNWERKGVKSGGLFNRDAKNAVIWNPTPQNLETLKKHLVQFIALATGGPARYEGDEMKTTHQDMKITNPEFDAAVGDFKTSLDRLQIPNKEQKELLAIIESTRPQVVTQR